MFGKYKNVDQRTDDDIMDEAAGKARLTMAADSAARRKAEQDRLRRQNEEQKARLKKVQIRRSSLPWPSSRLFYLS